MDKNCRKVTIYALIDPRDSRVRYVGKTVQPLAKRVKQHIGQAGKHRRQRCGNWILHLLGLGLEPTSIVLMELNESQGWEYWERFWIDWFRGLCPDLTNLAEGGEGGGVPATQYLDVPCEMCGTVVRKQLANIKRSAHRYCGRKCANRGQKLNYQTKGTKHLGFVTKSCLHCGVSFECRVAEKRTRGGRKFCSQECRCKSGHARRG